MVQDRSGMFGGGRGLGTQDVRAEAPRAHLVTRDEALAALDGMSGSARQVVAHLLSQAWAEGISFGPTVTLPVSTLEALGVVVARRRFEGPRRDWVLEHPQALVEDISELACWMGAAGGLRLSGGRAPGHPDW